MITFAIPTRINEQEQEILLNNLVGSIQSQTVQVPYEILVCGNYKIEGVTTLDFPEDENGTSYITRKQNLLLDSAKYENVVFLRDYQILWPDWIKGFLKHKNDWTILLSPILNKDNTRWRDLCHWDKPGVGGEWIQYEPWCKEGKVTHGKPHLPPYSDFEQRYCYVNGGYLVCKRDFMQKIRWSPELQWGAGEDCEMSFRMRDDEDCVIGFNPLSIVQLQKFKERILPVVPSEYFGSYEYVMSKYKV